MRRANQLITEKSPYLLQHAYNPVDWHPWQPEAFDKAKREDKPIFLSIGYSTCHWCHVMERESFENEETARLLNDLFVSIKVDREERPDIDDVYMNAVQQLSGRGGWPLSAFLLPDGRPFFGGTYFTPNRFRHLIQQGAAAYHDRHPEVEQAAGQIVSALERAYAPPSGVGAPELNHHLLKQALEVMEERFDHDHGGFGTAPKFPPHGGLRLLFHEYRATGDEAVLRMATRTLEAMALGGIRDHIGGGFHRYSTDAEWLLPHFEKMLYDNALLSRAYVEAFELTQDSFFREVADEVFDWAMREMKHPEGAFYSGVDADSEGVEGKFYVWRKEEVDEALDENDRDLFCRVYDVEEGGNYTDEVTHEKPGGNILHLKHRISELAEELGVPDLATRVADARARLRTARQGRVRPGTDDKITASWNGLMIASLAHAGRMLNEERYVEAAESAAEFVMTHMRSDGMLMRRWRDGQPKYPGYIEDYACLANGFLELGEATRNWEWVERGRELLETTLADFWDEEAGAFYFTGRGHERLIARPKDALDHPLPSGNGMAAQALVRLASLSGEQRHLDFAERALSAMAPWMAKFPQATESLILAVEMWLDARENWGQLVEKARAFRTV